jgi:hypothetical protein
MPEYAAGQRWTYRSREQDAGSTLVIGSVQKRLLKSTIVHVMVDGVVCATSADPIVISHMPFSKQAIDASVIELVETGVEAGPQFEEGIATWREHNGGVFDLTVAEAVDAVVSVGPAPQDDPFDELVTEMRAQQSEELVGELYRQLFALKQWFFLCDPDDPQSPVQWQFEEGANPTPALLAFTSTRRAASAAIELGLYPEDSQIRMMPAPVRDAVEWISGPHCANEWLCFNFTQENFPLYCDDAVQLLKNN